MAAGAPLETQRLVLRDFMSAMQQSQTTGG